MSLNKSSTLRFFRTTRTGLESPSVTKALRRESLFSLTESTFLLKEGGSRWITARIMTCRKNAESARSL